MRRRLLAAVVLATVLLPACGSDESPNRTIAFLRTTGIPPENQQAFLDELAAAGWEVGDNLSILNDDPSAGFDDEGEAVDAVEGFVADGADLVIALSTTSAMIAAQTSGDVPVLTMANDPVASGIVVNPRAPEGNITGLSFRVPADRTIDIARRLSADVSEIGLLYPPDDPGAAPIQAGLSEAADALDIPLVEETFRTDADIAAAADRFVAAGVDVVILANAPTTVRAFGVIERELQRVGLPSIGNTKTNPFAVAVLAPDVDESYRQLGRQAARLLGGADVADVPVEDPGSFSLVVRTSIARAFGIELSDDLLDQADEIIDD